MAIYYWKKTRVLLLLAAIGLMACSWKLFMPSSSSNKSVGRPRDQRWDTGDDEDIQNIPGNKNREETGQIVRPKEEDGGIGLVHVDGHEVDLEERRRAMNVDAGAKLENNGKKAINSEGGGNRPGSNAVPEKDKLLKPVLKPGQIGNFEPPDTGPRKGFGENGIGVQLNPADEAKYSQSKREFGFNMVISDQISLDRAVKDIRDPECKYWHYPEDLPTASVVVVFVNEGWSTLMRTVHSIFNTSPPHLLAEVVMVDDFSDKDHLGKRLEDYIAQPRFKDKVKLVRNKQREGLIRARTIGAVNAERGEVVVFLDAHCECSKNWLPPLLSRIKEDRTAVVCPLVDAIDADTYDYGPQGDGVARGVFNWDFFYKRIPVSEREVKRRKTHTEPYRSPVMAGGLFALSRSFFFDIGGYDSGLDIWGGEQYEISFKIWMCGGTLEFVPCSRVGHIYRRGGIPYSYPRSGNDGISVVSKNYLRVAEVWLDDHKEYFYRMKPDLRGKPHGDVTEQKKFREDHCPHSFQWFMDEVAYDIVERYPYPAENIAWGSVEAQGTHYCLDNMGKGVGAEIGMHPCHGYGGTQLFRLNKAGEFRINEECVYADGTSVRQQRCVARKHYGWEYDTTTLRITATTVSLCLDTDSGHRVFLAPCEDGKQSQKWTVTPTK
ncbi:N-acetylgalactosaminyltransferase 7-like [Ptychodera flava]|uniref:N-acetylgalactosaminyltransferase 7-like n=1 Tax=Ptychodera flava TaxID=63121 RepID=UPI00396A68B3